MENEIDNLYPIENPEEFAENDEQAEQPQDMQDQEGQFQEKDYYAQVPPDFHYTPVEIKHRVDWFVVLLFWVILGILGYVLFATTGIFEQ